MSFGRDILCMNLFSWTQNYIRLLDLLRKSEHTETSVNTIWNINKTKSRYKDRGLLKGFKQSAESILFNVKLGLYNGLKYKDVLLQCVWKMQRPVNKTGPEQLTAPKHEQDGKCRYKRKIEAHSCNHCCSKKKQYVLHFLNVCL